MISLAMMCDVIHYIFHAIPYLTITRELDIFMIMMIHNTLVFKRSFNQYKASRNKDQINHNIMMYLYSVISYVMLYYSLNLSFNIISNYNMRIGYNDHNDKYNTHVVERTFN